MIDTNCGCNAILTHKKDTKMKKILLIVISISISMIATCQIVEVQTNGHFLKHKKNRHTILFGVSSN